MPLLLQDMYAISLQGPPWNAHVNHQPGAGPGMAAATFLPDLFGVGIQNYGSPAGAATVGPGAGNFGSGGGTGHFKTGGTGKFKSNSGTGNFKP